jgi:hypothetical protein
MTPSVHTLIADLGKALGFEVHHEVPASEGAWVDVVWFDKRLAPSGFGGKTSTIRHAPVLPVVGFEIELATGGSAKHVKGSVSNLANLGAQMSVVVICNTSIMGLKKRTKAFAGWTDRQVEKVLMDRVYRWVFAESRPSGRLVIMSEAEVVAWAGRHGVNSASTPVISSVFPTPVTAPAGES